MGAFLYILLFYVLTAEADELAILSKCSWFSLVSMTMLFILSNGINTVYQYALIINLFNLKMCYVFLKVTDIDKKCYVLFCITKTKQNKDIFGVEILSGGHWGNDYTAEKPELRAQDFECLENKDEIDVSLKIS